MKDNKNTQVEEAFEIIKQKIISYELEPGTSISVNSLAQELNMSRTPVREAILLLQSYGLVSVNGTIHVTKLELSDIVEICQVREAVETQAVRIIIENGGLNEEQLKELWQIATDHATAVGSINNKQFFHSGALFHQRIVEFSGNMRLVEIFERMSLQNKRAQWLNALRPERHSASNSEHRLVIEGLETRDLEKALEGVRIHANYTIESYRNILNTPELCRAILELSTLIKQQ